MEKGTIRKYFLRNRKALIICTFNFLKFTLPIGNSSVDLRGFGTPSRRNFHKSPSESKVNSMFKTAYFVKLRFKKGIIALQEFAGIPCISFIFLNYS